jgi:predicted phosphodiesterase
MKLKFIKKIKNSLIVILLTITIANSVYGQSISGTEMLGRPTVNSISVKAIFDTVVQVRIVYGTVSGSFPLNTGWQTITQDAYNDAVAVVNITGLNSGTKYYYKLQYRIPGDTLNVNRPEHSFTTARNPGEAFTFVIQADPHLDAASDTALYRVCLKNQLDDNPDFMIDLGDNFMTDKLKRLSTNQVPEDTIPYRCKLLRYYYETVNHSVPLYLVLGNHEGECGWYNNGTANNIAVWDTKYRKKYYMNPVPDAFYSGDTTNYPYIGQREAYYSWTWGDALFVVLDPFWNTTPKPDSLNCWRWTLGKVQYDWLKTTLENSPSPYKFVFIHNLVGGNSEGRGGIEYAPYYEWGGASIDGTNGWSANRPGWYKPIKELLEENKVAIVFHGHDHFFGKQELDCLIYQEVPQPDFPNFTSAQQAIKYGYTHGVIIPPAGHLRVNVSPSGVSVDYVRAAKPSQETANLHNKDVSHTYNINLNCYDTLHSSINTWQGSYFDVIAVYPNPAKNVLFVEIEEAKDHEMLIELHSLSGEVIAYGKIKKGDMVLKLDISNLPSGIYLLKVFSENGTNAFKISIYK